MATPKRVPLQSRQSSKPRSKSPSGSHSSNSGDKNGIPKWLLTVGGILLAVGIIGLRAYFRYESRLARRDRGNDQAQTSASVSGDPTVNLDAIAELQRKTEEAQQRFRQSVSSNTATTTSEASESAIEKMVSESRARPAMPPAASSEPGFQKPSESGFKTLSNEAILTASAEWDVVVDGVDFPIGYELEKSLELNLGKTDLRKRGVIFPLGPSPLLAFISEKSGKDPSFRIIDASNGKTVGNVPASVWTDICALSPDGSYLAMSSATEIVVHDMKARKSLGSLKTGTEYNVRSIGIFKNQLIGLSDVKRKIWIWELPSGELKHVIDGGERCRPGTLSSFSPGGKYVAVEGNFLEKRIDIYNLQTAKLVGSISVERKHSELRDTEAFAFSKDGQYFATVYEYGYKESSKSRFVVWNVETKQPVQDFYIEPSLNFTLDPTYQNHALESIPNSSRWMIYGLGIVDVEKQELVHRFEKQADVELYRPREAINDHQVISVTNEGGEVRVKAESF